MTSTMTVTPAASANEDVLTAEELRNMHAWWRAANYLSVGQIYLLDDPLLREPPQLEHIKPRSGSLTLT
jgi:xylulose-5-phosphate/fructose-6-phosphate phosphoketolase